MLFILPTLSLVLGAITTPQEPLPGRIEKDFSESTFSELRDDNLSRSIWAVVKIVECSTCEQRFQHVSVRGAAWLVKSTQNGYVFVTAAHLFEDISMGRFNTPNESILFLVHSGFPSLRLTNRNVSVLKDSEIAIIKTPKFDGQDLEPLTTGSLREKVAVYNVGFPNRAFTGKNIFLNFAPDPEFSFQGGPWFQEGSFNKTLRLSLDSGDMSFEDLQVIYLDYSSEPGFSGGPLFSKEDDRVVGMMIGVLTSQKYNPMLSVRSFGFALYIDEIIGIVDEHLGIESDRSPVSTGD